MVNWLLKTASLSAVLFLAGCGTLFDKHVVWEYEQPENFPVIKAVGYAPISSQPGDNMDMKNLMAMRASKLDAYRELAEQVYGQQIQSRSEMNNMIASNDKLRSRVDGVIRGARVIKSYPVGDNYATEVELDMKLVFDLYQIEKRPRTIKRVDYY